MMKIFMLLCFLSLSFVIKSGCEATSCGVYGDVRLVGGRTALEGRVEVCNNTRAWNRVCKDNWDNNDAVVVCRQLGFSQVDSLALTRQGVQSFLNSTATRFLFNNVNCHGLESRLIECSSNKHASCDPSGIEDAGVRCTNIVSLKVNASYSDTSVRLTWNPVDNQMNLEAKCFYIYNNTTHTTQSMVSSNIMSVQLDRLSPSTLYNCCVSMSSSATCIEVTTLTSNKSESLSTECTNNGSGIAVGVLSFLIAVLVVLLILAGAALVYLITTILKQKEQLRISRNLNVKVRQLETEKNPSYCTGNIARKDFKKYNQTAKSQIGNRIDSVRRYGEIQKSKKDYSKEASSQRGMHGKHLPTRQKLTPEENIEMNPSYSTLPLPGVGEYSTIGPLYEKSANKSKLSASLKVTTTSKEGIIVSPTAKSFSISGHYAGKQQREGQDGKSEQAQKLNFESNPAYSALPGSDGEYSLVGPAYHKVSKATASDGKTKHEYAEIKEANTESRDNFQENYSSSLTGSACDRTGLKGDEDHSDRSSVQHGDSIQPVDVQPSTEVKGRYDAKENLAIGEEDNAGNKDGIIEEET